jgi:hypothetical protein
MNSKPQPPNSPWSSAGIQRLKKKLSPRDEKGDTLMSGLAYSEPFPQLSNYSFDEAHDQAIYAWTRFREGKGEPMGMDTCMAVSGLKSVKPRGKKKWLPMALDDP